MRAHPGAPRLLRRTGPLAPDAAALRRELVIVLTRPGPLSLRPGLALADLHDPRLIGMYRRHPDEAVAGEVHTAAAASKVVLPRVHHPSGVVLGVGAGDHDVVPSKELDTFRV